MITYRIDKVVGDYELMLRNYDFVSPGQKEDFDWTKTSARKVCVCPLAIHGWSTT